MVQCHCTLTVSPGARTSELTGCTSWQLPYIDIALHVEEVANRDKIMLHGSERAQSSGPAALLPLCSCFVLFRVMSVSIVDCSENVGQREAE